MKQNTRRELRQPFLWALALISVIVLGLWAQPLRAQTVPPWQAADEGRQALFNAQTAVLDGDTATAKAQLAQARTALGTFVEQLTPFDAPLAQEITARAAQLSDFTSSPDLAARRAYVWALVLRGGYTATLSAIDQNQPDAAQQWFQIRVFRKTTRVTMASANGTQALADWRAGKTNAAHVKTQVQTDLQDTYTAVLRDALSAVEKAIDKEIPESAAENAATAHGYFGIIRDAFAAQHGAAEAAQLDQSLAQLTDAAVAGQWDAVKQHLAAVHARFDGFSPIPLSEKDIATKSAQLLQFLDLIQIEYEKGVRNGQVSVPIEYQEAKTFHEQSLVLLGEIRPILAAKNAPALDQLSTHLTTLGQLIGRVAEPSETGPVVNASMAVLKEAFGVQAAAGDIPSTLTLLKQMGQMASTGNWQEAELLRLQAYAIYEVGAEQKLLTREPALGDELQSLFWEGTANTQGLAVLIKDKAGMSAINQTLTLMNTRFGEAQTLLDTKMTAAGAIAASVAILLREGLEAVLVIAAVLGYLRATQAPKRAQVQVLGGAGIGIALSLIIWALAQTVISITPVNRELFEGIIALTAAAVLFYVTNWLLHKVYIADWMAFVKAQVQKAMGNGAAFGFAILGFMVVFREGFETVLFFQALLFDAPAWAVAVGALIGAIIIGAIAFIMLRYSVRIPLKPFFTWTGILLLILAVSFVGNGVRNLQEAGWIGVSRLDIIPSGSIPALLGLFPTVQTTAAQIFVLLALATTFIISKMRAKPMVAAKAA